MSDVFEYADGQWTFPARMSILPEEARSRGAGHMIGAPRKEYVRADISDAALLAGIRAGIEAAAVKVMEGKKDSAWSNPVRDIRALDPAAIASAVTRAKGGE